ncbi:MAG: 2'-5' RNA ligase family protein [Balneolales bacterium]
MIDNTTSSLWLKPIGTVYDELSMLINELAREHGSPRFEPHVTLISGLNSPIDHILNKIDKMSMPNNSVEIQLGKIGYKNNRFQSFFAHVENEDIFSLREQCKKAIGHQDIEEFMPHLSLMYHEMPEKKKEALSKRLGDTLDMKFTATQIHVISTNGEPEEWKEIAAINLDD